MNHTITAAVLLKAGDEQTAIALLKSAKWSTDQIDKFVQDVKEQSVSPAAVEGPQQVTPAESPLMLAALDAVNRGWFVFALKERGKEPDSKFSPHGFNSSTNDAAVVRQIWTEVPNANYGIDLGRSNLTVLDFDNGRPPAGLIPATLQVSTSRGTHAYYLGTTKQGKMKSGDTLLGDIKSGGGYVLGPGCVHPSGAVYTPVLNAPIAPVPALDTLRGAADSKPVDVSLTGPKVPRGEHDNTLTLMARKLRGVMGLDQEAIYDHLVKLVETRFEGYGSDYLEMCQKHAKSAMKFEPNPVGKMLQMPTPVVVAAPEAKPLVVIDGDNFLAEVIPPREVLVHTISGGEPVIFEQSINQIFAWRGVGKTCLGLGFVRAIATGGHFLNFRAASRSHVLYIEGELPDSQMQERWKSIVGPTDGFAHLATIDKQPGHTFQSLATEEGMQRVETALTTMQQAGVQVKVLMLDNISTLFNIAANDEDTWVIIQSWLTSLRSRGLTIFYFHHAGKGGASRSHSKSEDMLDVSIKLEAPDDQEQGHLHAVMSFDKARAGLSEKPAEIKLLRSHSVACFCSGGDAVLYCPGDGTRWEHKPIRNDKVEAEKQFSLGRSVAEVAADLGKPLGTVKTWRTHWAANQPAKGMAKP